MRAVSIWVVLIVMFAMICDVGLAQKVVYSYRTVERGGLRYEINSEVPLTGTIVVLYRNGQKRGEGEYRDGKRHGKATEWYENGQKKSYGEFRDGELIRLKTWDENGKVTFDG